MSENRVLKRIIGSIRNWITGEWRKLHVEYPYGLYSSPNIIRERKLRRMIMKEQTGGTGEGKEEVHTGFWWCDVREWRLLDDAGLEETIILKLIGLFQLAQDKDRWLALLTR